MSDVEPDGQDLWRRYRAARPPVDAVEPDFGLLAAYIDGQLDETAAAPVERWLAHNPDALALVRRLDDSVLPMAPLGVIRRARALVAGNPAGGWRHAAAWGSIAASLVLVGMTGFLAGHDTVARNEAIATTISSDIVFGPTEGDGDGAAVF